MDINAIKALVYICETGSFLKASKLLNVTQPTLSNWIDRLEYMLGETLFIRSKGKSSPTELAVNIARDAKPMFMQFNQLEMDIKTMAAGKSGLIRLGIGPAAYPVFFNIFLIKFKSLYPDVSIEITTGKAIDLMHQLEIHMLDIVISQVPKVNIDDVICNLYQEEHTVIAVTAPDSVLLKKTELSLRDLFIFAGALPHLQPEHKEFIEMQCLPQKWNYQQNIFCSDYQTLKGLVKNGDYYTIGPEYLFTEELNEGVLIKLNVSFPFKHKIGCFTTSDRITPLTRNFIDMYMGMATE